MDDLLSEFLAETSESLAQLDLELVKFEQNPNDSAILGNIFRLVHTIKGTSGFLGLPRLEKVAHAGEDVLGKFRDGALTVTPEAVTLILHCLDCVRSLLAGLEAEGTEPQGEDTALIDALHALAEGRVPPPVAMNAAAAPEPVADPAPVSGDGGFPVAQDLLAEVERALAEGKQAASDSDMAAEIAAERDSETGSPKAEPVSQDESPTEAAPAQLPARTAAQPPAGAQQAAVPAQRESAKESAVAAQSIRVNVDLLENLMTLISELVLTRNQLLQMVRGQDDSVFTVPLQRLSHITTDLQDGVMRTRMQPIGNAWAKLPRIIRDLSVEAGKKIDLQMIGAETELDRQVLELIKDPLTHMVRNSADHGLEMPADRLGVGKPEIGSIVLKAFHEGGHIIIEISDDGRGLNMNRIRRKIIENALASEADLDAMSDQQIQRFIFKAGFSTAEKVTSVSGRGVGMDVVRTNIERIGGTIELVSVEGKGTTFTIKIPLTLAIVSALIVESGGERFAIPQISVLELVRAAPNAEYKVERISSAPVLRLRNRLLPLVSLRELLELPDRGRKNAVQAPALNERQIKLVQGSFAAVEPIAEQAAEMFYNRLFELDPSLSHLFTSDMKAQGRKLMSMLKVAVTSLNRLDSLLPALVNLAKRHDTYGVKPSHYDTVGQALLWTLERGLGAAFTKDVKDAWAATYKLISAVMTETQRQVEKAAQPGGERAADSYDEEVFIVVAQVGAHTFGIVVDRVFDTEEIVVKPVAPILRNIPFYSGNTILGDGSVIMILDPNGIATASGNTVGAHNAPADGPTSASGEDDSVSLLVFRAGGDELKAVPLALVARLEEVPVGNVEHAHGACMVQYRGGLMPLVPFNPNHVWRTEGRQPVIVFTDRGRSMGLVVDAIVDTVDDRLRIELAADQPGLIGSAVIDGKATDVIDAGYYLTQAYADWFGAENARIGQDKRKRLLLVDDNAFFRNLMKPLLDVAGYAVTSVTSVEDALRMRDEGAEFDIIVSDIHMPGSDGFMFAEAVRSGGRWKDTPIVALAENATPADFERGRQVGFDDCVAKFDRGAIVQTLAQVANGTSVAA
jgi:chemotaxis protein histidine kinase CheA/CheY-like chemotaxis protein